MLLLGYHQTAFFNTTVFPAFGMFVIVMLWAIYEPKCRNILRCRPHSWSIAFLPLSLSVWLEVTQPCHLSMTLFVWVVGRVFTQIDQWTCGKLREGFAVCFLRHLPPPTSQLRQRQHVTHPSASRTSSQRTKVPQYARVRVRVFSQPVIVSKNAAWRWYIN